MLENYNHVLFEIKKKSDFHGGESVRALEMGKLWCWWRLMLSHSVRAHEWTANTRRLGQPPRLEGRPPAWGTWLDQRRIVATRAHLSSRMQSVTTAASRQATEACSLHWAIIKKKPTTGRASTLTDADCEPSHHSSITICTKLHSLSSLMLNRYSYGIL